MSLLATVEPEPVELEIELLIHEARHRQRRRRLRLAVVSGVVIAGGGVSIGAIGGGRSAVPIRPRAGSPSAVAAGTPCQASPVRSVANSQFDAYVAGNGRVRLGMGVRYAVDQRRVVVEQRSPRSWAGIEAIWWLRDPYVRGPITVRGVALGKQGPIEVQPSDGGLAPGSGALVLPSNFQPAPGASAYPEVYPGSIWVRSGGCYAVDLSARGFRERIVFDVLTRQE